MINRIISICAAIVLLCGLQGCNYHYYKGLKLEEQQRYEEANIEYRQAYIESSNNSKFAEAFQRTAVKTSESLLKRYYRYLKEEKYPQAFKVLEQARTLAPKNTRIKVEGEKWFKVLLAGKVELTDISSFLINQIPLTEEIGLEIQFNTRAASRKLNASIHYQTKIFKIEDVLYNPQLIDLMSYSINSIGLKLVNSTTGKHRFKKFINFKSPTLISIKGDLNEDGFRLTPIEKFLPPLFALNSAYNNEEYRSPSSDKNLYSLILDGTVIKVDSSSRHIDFLPQTFYVNKKDRRYFLNFGHFELSRKKNGGFWMLRRLNPSNQTYLPELKKSIILNPYFYFREGGYPFIIADDDLE